MIIERTVEAPISPERAFAYLSDFETTAQWDAGTVRTTRQSGDGGLGTKYLNVSKFLGRETELVYTVAQYRENELFAVQGVNKTVTADDTMTFAPTASGVSVTYRAQFRFKGWVRFIQPLLAPALKKLGDEAEVGLRRELNALAATEG